MNTPMNPKRQYHRKRFPVAGEPFVYLIRLKDSAGTLYAAPGWQLGLEVTYQGGKREVLPMSQIDIDGQPCWQYVFPGNWTRQQTGFSTQIRVERKHVTSGRAYYDVTETVQMRDVVLADSVPSTDILNVTIDQVTEIAEVTVDTVILPLYTELEGLTPQIAALFTAAQDAIEQSTDNAQQTTADRQQTGQDRAATTSAANSAVAAKEFVEDAKTETLAARDQAVKYLGNVVTFHGATEKGYKLGVGGNVKVELTDRTLKIKFAWQ